MLLFGHWVCMTACHVIGLARSRSAVRRIHNRKQRCSSAVLLQLHLYTFPTNRVRLVETLSIRAAWIVGESGLVVVNVLQLVGVRSKFTSLHEMDARGDTRARTSNVQAV